MSLRIAAAFAAVSVLSATAGCAVQAPAEPPPPPSPPALPTPSPAQTHPAYLQVLGQLRQVRWLVRHRAAEGGPTAHEQIALDELDAAVEMIRAADFDDGLGADDRAPPGLPGVGAPRLRLAAAFMRRVNLEVSMEQDGKFAQGLRGRVLQHTLDAAVGISNAFHELDVPQ